MKKYMVLASFLFLGMASNVQAADDAEQSCFIAKEQGKVVKQTGACKQRHSPCSSFKIAIALMGFDSGILKDANHPKYPYQKEYEKTIYLPYFKLQAKALTPQSWMQNSAVWYSQVVTQKLGMTQFKYYAKKLNYGNSDVSGTPGKNDGLRNAWLNTSLQISPREQVDFVENLSNKALAVSQDAQEKTIEITKLEDIWGDWSLHGKTGSCRNGGWFVGWIEKGDRRIAFAQYFAGDSARFPLPLGRMAKEVAKDNLIELL